jgi:hypothetical protein
MGHLHITRTRWAAIGAVIAITLGAGGVGIGQAALSSGERLTFVPINPCRLVDTRMESTVGSRSTPLGAADTMTLQAHGVNGECTISTGAAALSINVTTIGASEHTFLTIYPAGEAMPLASHLNPVPGEPPTPNEVPVKLGASGAFNVFNRFGEVDIVVDVVGYFEDHNHDDRYYTKSETYSKPEIDAAIAAIPTVGNVYTTAQTDALLDDKADVGDSYTKAESDAQLSGKADVGDSYTKPETDQAIADAVDSAMSQPVVTPHTGSVASTPEAQGAIENFTTDRDGALFVSRAYTLSMTCLLGTPIGYLVVDGTPVQASVTLVGTVPGHYTITGIVPTSTAGPHTVRVGLECTGADLISVSSIDQTGSASVIVIPT